MSLSRVKKSRYNELKTIYNEFFILSKKREIDPNAGGGGGYSLYVLIYIFAVRMPSF